MLFGQNTWVVPAVADNGKFQTLALAQAAGGHVVVGSTTASSPAEDAFASYRAFLGDRTAAGASTPRVNGTIDRFAYAAGRVWFTLRDRRGVFTIVDPAGPDVLLARPGRQGELRDDARRERRTARARLHGRLDRAMRSLARAARHARAGRRPQRARASSIDSGS